ncbi:MAG: AbiV family abortive infection protein [Alphaproteobacteria bacterium]|nr:AbiV family abortive infection protein [Alphaproteobacteria bacterium]
MSYLSDREHEILAACVKQAEDLLLSAEASLDKGVHHVAYHLAALALEELGKRELIKLHPVSRIKKEPSGWLKKGQSDHVKKLFWSVFGGTSEGKEMTPKFFEELKDFSDEVHAKRLMATYVDHEVDEVLLPRDKISLEEAQNIVSFCRARLDLAKSEKRRDKISQDEIDTQKWFIQASENPEQRKFVFSKTSIEKLNEIGHKNWILWLKAEFRRIEAEEDLAFKKEIERSKNLPQSGTYDKWKVKVRFYSASHTIRPKALQVWNDQIDWLKLHPAGKNNDEIVAEIIMQDDVPIEAVWHFSYGLLRTFLVALNAATMGFWWWYPTKRTDDFYESIHDLESKNKLEISPQEPMNLVWPVKLTLKEEQMRGVMSFLSKMPPGPKINEFEEFNRYLEALTFLGVRSPHWDSKEAVFTNFAKCLKVQLSQVYSGSFIDNFNSYLDENFAEAEDHDRATELIDHHLNRTPLSKSINTKDLMLMKFLCDAAFNVFFLKGKRITM